VYVVRCQRRRKEKNQHERGGREGGREDEGEDEDDDESILTLVSKEEEKKVRPTRSFAARLLLVLGALFLRLSFKRRGEGGREGEREGR